MHEDRWKDVPVSLLVGTGVLLLGAGIYRYREMAVDEAGLVMKIVRNKANYVSIPDSDLRRFAGDYVKEPDWRVRGLLQSGWLNNYYSSHDIFCGEGCMVNNAQIEMLEHIVVTDLLMATDYFSGQTDPGRSSQYKGNEKSGCKNPFAVFK